MRRRYKPFLQTDDFIEEITTMTVAAVVTPCTTATKRDYVALYVIGKDIIYKVKGKIINILYKKSRGNTST